VPVCFLPTAAKPVVSVPEPHRLNPRAFARYASIRNCRDDARSILPRSGSSSRFACAELRDGLPAGVEP
jgi:hypothetical protein